MFVYYSRQIIDRYSRVYSHLNKRWISNIILIPILTWIICQYFVSINATESGKIGGISKKLQFSHFAWIAQPNRLEQSWQCKYVTKASSTYKRHNAPHLPSFNFGILYSFFHCLTDTQIPSPSLPFFFSLLNILYCTPLYSRFTYFPS